MAASLENTLISVWRQSLIEGSKAVTVDGRSFPIRKTSRSKLREVDFEFDGQMLRGLEQNPKTASRWAHLAREGNKVMQFLSRRQVHRRCCRRRGAVLREDRSRIISTPKESRVTTKRTCSRLQSFTNLTVECYSGRKADERPIRFRIEGRQYEVKAVVDQWYEPDSISYKVKADDENFYILRHETSKPSGTWDLVSFRRSGNEG